MAPVFEIFSLPAKSTRYNFPILENPSFLLVWFIVKIKILWLLEECSFIFVAAWALLALPISNKARTSFGHPTYLSLAPSTYIPFIESSLIFKLTLETSNKSLIFSW